MIIYHIADVHLGSKMLSLKEEVASKRRNKIFSFLTDAFKRIHDEGSHIVLLPGDIFDEDSPLENDLENFYHLILSYPDINFYYLRGNHDLIKHQNNIDNLFYFDSKFKIYKDGDINIGGIELNKDNLSSFYNEIKFNEDEYNILMLHGDINNDIDLKKLKDKNIDYIALGHLHTYQKGELDKRTSYAYSGVFLGRGNDETNLKGYIRFNTSNNDISFIPSSKEIILEDDIDISTALSSFEAANIIKNKYKDMNIILRLNIVGDIKFSRPSEGIKQYLENLLSDYYLSISIKDHTSDYIDIDSYTHSKSFIGEFINTVNNNSSLSIEEKKKIIYLGIKALKGEIKG